MNLPSLSPVSLSSLLIYLFSQTFVCCVTPPLRPTVFPGSQRQMQTDKTRLSRCCQTAQPGQRSVSRGEMRPRCSKYKNTWSELCQSLKILRFILTTTVCLSLCFQPFHSQSTSNRKNNCVTFIFVYIFVKWHR